MRLSPFAVAALLTAAAPLACADADYLATSTVPASALKVTVSGAGKMWVIAPDAEPNFSELNVDVITANDLANPAADVAPQGAASLGHLAMQSASAGCAVDGCGWHMPSVPLGSASMGLIAAVSDARTINPLWQTTYSAIVNPNQVQDNVLLGSSIAAFAPSYVMAASSMARLASVLAISEAELLARGVCLGLVWQSRGEGPGIGAGLAGARIGVGGESASAPSLFYVNDAMSALAASGVTNRDGLFVLVGPTARGATTAASYAVPITVTQTDSQLNYVGSVAIVRPGVLSVMPIIPAR